MAAPVVNPASSILSFNQWLSWSTTIIASGTPFDFRIDSGVLPPGMSFQPSLTSTSSSSNAVHATAHGLANGTCLVARALSGATGLSTGTRYFVINADADPNSFQLATTPGGSSISFSYTSALFYQPGVITGAASVPGVYPFTVYATNSTGESAAGVTYTIGIKPAAAVADANLDAVWNFATGDFIRQTDANLNLTPVARTEPVFKCKSSADFILRLRTVKDSSIIDLQTIADGACKLYIKELETDPRVVVSVNSRKSGSGDNNSILVYANISSDALNAAFGNYESDAGTLFNAIAELELVYPNPGYFDGTPETFTAITNTFTIQIERHL